MQLNKIKDRHSENTNAITLNNVTFVTILVELFQYVWTRTTRHYMRGKKICWISSINVQQMPENFVQKKFLICVNRSKSLLFGRRLTFYISHWKNRSPSNYERHWTFRIPRPFMSTCLQWSIKFFFSATLFRVVSKCILGIKDKD